MTKILISFCNVFPYGLGLGVFDYETEKFEWIDLDSIKTQVTGVTGTTFHNGKYCCLIQENANARLCIFDKNFDIEESHSLQNTHDAHSIIPYEDGFLVNDTLKNRINKVNFSQEKNEIIETEFWKYNNETTDTVHLNSVTKFNGKLFASLFGPKSGDSWSTAETGKIIQIPENKILVNDLLQPHTLCHDDESLYFLESKNGSLHKITKDGLDEVIVKVEGYARGLVFDEKFFYVGSSARRLKSKSMGTINPEETKEPDRYHSWLYRINRETLEIERKDLTMYGSEIYDLILLSHDFNFQNKINPIIFRMWKYEIEHATHQDTTNLLQKKAKKDSTELKKIKKSNTWKILKKLVEFKNKFKK